MADHGPDVHKGAVVFQDGHGVGPAQFPRPPGDQFEDGLGIVGGGGDGAQHLPQSRGLRRCRVALAAQFGQLPQRIGVRRGVHGAAPSGRFRWVE